MTYTQRLDDLIHAHTTAYNIYADHVKRWHGIHAASEQRCASPVEHMVMAEAIKSWEARMAEEVGCIAMLTELKASHLASGKPDMAIPDPLEHFGEAWWTVDDVFNAAEEEGYVISKAEAEAILRPLDTKLKDAMVLAGWELVTRAVHEHFKQKGIIT